MHFEFLTKHINHFCIIYTVQNKGSTVRRRLLYHAVSIESLSFGIRRFLKNEKCLERVKAQKLKQKRNRARSVQGYNSQLVVFIGFYARYNLYRPQYLLPRYFYRVHLRAIMQNESEPVHRFILLLYWNI